MLVPRSTRATITIPAALSVIVLGACGPTAPSSDGGDAASDSAASCAPWETDASAPPAALRAMIDLAPCPATSSDPQGSSCTTATGCSVIYDVAQGAEFAPSFVSCRVNDDRCLVGFDSAGAPRFERCPTVDLPLTCYNNISLVDIRDSNFACGATQPCMMSGVFGQRSASFIRNVSGMVSRSQCPSECLPAA